MSRRLIIFVVAGLLMVMATMACGSTPPPPHPGNPPPLTIEEYSLEVRFNYDRAVELYGDRWFTITVGPFLRVNGTEAVFRNGDGRIIFSFVNESEALSIGANERVAIVCYVKVPKGFTGYALGDKMFLKYCQR